MAGLDQVTLVRREISCLTSLDMTSGPLVYTVKSHDIIIPYKIIIMNNTTTLLLFIYTMTHF